MSATEQPIRILVVDDQALLRVGLRMVLEAEPGLEVIGEAGDGREAIRRVVELEPDVVLMDIRMPVLDGVRATAELTAVRPATKVLVVTTFDLDEYAFGALRAGASGFLLKDAPPAELVGAIRAVAAGEAAISTRVTRRLLELFGDRIPFPARTDEPGEDGAAADPLAALTHREREVLTAIAEGLSNPEIAERFTVSESTVKTHVGRVLAKLGLRDRVHAVIFAYEHGLVG